LLRTQVQIKLKPEDELLLLLLLLELEPREALPAMSDDPSAMVAVAVAPVERAARLLVGAFANS